MPLETYERHNGEVRFARHSGVLPTKNVEIGQLVPVSPGAVQRRLAHWENAYTLLGSFETVLNRAAAHHRLLWVHPFLDENRQVARLISHAMLRNALDTGGLWSVARGLARNTATYKGHLAACDLQRRNDLDGRSNLTVEALVDFTRFFLCLDQIEFIENLMRPNELRTPFMAWADDEIRTRRLHEKAKLILDLSSSTGTPAQGYTQYRRRR